MNSCFVGQVGAISELNLQKIMPGSFMPGIGPREYPEAMINQPFAPKTHA